MIEEKRTEFEARDKDASAVAERIQRDVNGSIVTVIEQAGEDGRLYGSVQSSQITESLEQTSGTKIQRKDIRLDNPIKYIGVHDVTIELYGGLEALIHVNVSRSKAEAEEAEQKFKRCEVVMEGPDANKDEEEAPIETAAEENISDDTTDETTDVVETADSEDKTSEEAA